MAQVCVSEKEDHLVETYQDELKLSSSSTARDDDHETGVASAGLSAEEELDAQQRVRRNRRWYISLGSIIVFLLFMLVVLVRLVRAQEEGWKRVGEEQRRQGSSESNTSAKGRRVKRSESASARPEYSFATKDDGEVATYVYATRPIVNPGGYTIGTLTGYVTYTGKPFTTTASAAAAAATSSSVPEATWTWSSTTHSKTKTGERKHHTSSSSTKAHSHLFETASPTHESHHSESSRSPTPTPTPTPAPTLPDSLLQFLVGHPKRVKRSFEQDRQQEVLEFTPFTVPPITAAPVEDGREYSYSIRKDGRTATFVKTTRPIVNPAGYTIGTLDGVFVELKTSRVQPTGVVGRAGVRNPKVQQPVVRSREELRKRKRGVRGFWSGDAALSA